jgi:hypothetical protein
MLELQNIIYYEMSKLKLLSNLIVGYDIMHEHDNQRDLWSPLTGAFNEYMVQSYIAIMGD